MSTPTFGGIALPNAPEAQGKALPAYGWDRAREYLGGNIRRRWRIFVPLASGALLLAGYLLGNSKCR